MPRGIAEFPQRPQTTPRIGKAIPIDENNVGVLRAKAGTGQIREYPPNRSVLPGASAGGGLCHRTVRSARKASQTMGSLIIAPGLCGR